MTDILEMATAEARVEGAVLSAERKQALRLRVLARPRAKVTAARWVIPIAAVIASATAWAGWTTSTNTASQVVTAKAPTPALPTQSPEAPRYEALVAVASSSARPSVPSPVTTVTTSAQNEESRERRALRVYREAERLQLKDGDFSRALDAWDRYLAVAGQSPLVIDARYNRAVCLARLGRRDEAREALLPFASGDASAYLQAEAKALLETL